jgi:hypothetical protein
LVKNGQVIDRLTLRGAWNEDGGTSSEWSYKNVPFYPSQHERGPARLPLCRRRDVPRLCAGRGRGRYSPRTGVRDHRPGAPRGGADRGLGSARGTDGTLAAVDGFAAGGGARDVCGEGHGSAGGPGHGCGAECRCSAIRDFLRVLRFERWRI